MILGKRKLQPKKLLIWTSLTAMLWQALTMPVWAADVNLGEATNVQSGGTAVLASASYTSNRSSLTATGPALLITEVVVSSDTIKTDKTYDLYEYIEVYNNSGQDLETKDLQFGYRYPTYPSKKDLVYALNNQIIHAGESFVIWTKNAGNKNLTISDFKQRYGLTVDDRQIIELSWDGMANTDQRTLILTDAQDTAVSRPIVSTTYVADDVKKNQGIHFVVPGSGIDMVKQGVSDVSPLTVRQDQLTTTNPNPNPSTQPISIVHTAPTYATAGDNLALTTVITGGDAANRTQLVEFKTDKMTSTTQLPLQTVTDSVYQVTLPANQLVDASSVEYTFQATDGKEVKRSTTFTVPVLAAGSGTMPAYVPELLVTELVPNSANVGGSDGYEFIEVYNTTDKPIDMKDYTIRYRYPADGPEADLWWRHTMPVTVPAGEAVVFWIINAENGSKTAADFNANYGSNLAEGVNLFRLYNNGMANGSHRGVVLSTNTGKELSAAIYNDTADLADNKLTNGAIIYQYNEQTFPSMKKVSAAVELGTPGTLLPYQKLPQLVQTVPDMTPPQISLHQVPTQAADTQDLKLVFDVSDDRDVKTVTLYYRTDASKPYVERNIHNVNADKTLSYTIAASELIGHQTVELYAVASDGTHTTPMNLVTIPIHTEQQQGLRLNVNNGQFVSGDVLIKAASSNERTDTLQLFVDGARIANDQLKPAMEQQVLFSFDVNKTNLFFQNGVVFNGEIIQIMSDTINGWKTITVPLDVDKLIYGSHVPITIRAGSKAGTFDESDNLDDFNLRNIRLVLADGTVLYDPNYADPAKEWDIGDSAGMKKQHDYVFQIPDRKYNGYAYQWDTKRIADGQHTVKVSEQGAQERTVEVIVDNTAPLLDLNVMPQQVLKGALTIQAEVKDALSGIASLTATLDGKPVQLPLTLSSVLLPAGKHVFTAKAVDRAGNVTEKISELTVQTELPDIPKLVTNVLNAAKTEGTLAVQVKDPTNDALKVTFYEGFAYTPTDTSTMKVYQAASDVEPPAVEKLPSEQLLQADQLKAIAQADSSTVRSDSWTQFPYQRYELQVDNRVAATDEISFTWSGKSLPGRKVTMYAWNVKDNKWDAVASQVAGSDSFSLTGHAVIDSYLSVERKVSIIVQDEVAPVVGAQVKDFTLVWMSDTQYYSESYPYIYESQVNWIAANKDKENIRYVFHTGDVVDKMDQEIQWMRADSYMKILEQAEVPYGVLAGNHDVNHKDENYTKFNQYFGEKRFEDKSFYGGSYKDNRGHYDLISVDGIDMIMVYMGWGIYEEEIAWMNEVLAQYPDRLAILNFHEYLLVSGERGPTGNQIYEQVVKPNANVIGVLSGHYHDAETKIDAIDDDGDGKPDRNVYQMLADYQGGPEGGEGYMRLLEFTASADGKRIERIDMKTYSPHKDKYNYYDAAQYPGKDEFVVNWDVAPQLKRVETDLFRAEIFTKHSIQTVENVSSGTTVSAVWKDLDTNANYAWYVVAEDDFGGSSRSPVWSLSKSNDTGNNGGGPGGSGGSGGTGGSGGSGNTGGSTTQPAQPQPQPPAQSNKIDVMADQSGNTDVWTLSDATKQLIMERIKAHPQQTIMIYATLGGSDSAATNIWNLALPADVIQEAAKQGTSLQVTIGNVQIDIPATALQQFPAGGGQLLLHMESRLTNQELLAYAKQWAAMGLVWTGEAFRLSAEVSQDGKIESAPGTMSGIRVTRTGALHNGGWYVQPAEAGNKPVKSSSTAGFLQGNLSEQAELLGVSLMSKSAFQDINGHWAQSFIELATALGLTNGISSAEYKPNASVSRAEFAVMLVRTLERLYGISADPSQSSFGFKDVSAKAWYADEVAAAAQLNLVQGNGEQFHPDAPVTRQEAVVMLMRAIELAGLDTSRFDSGQLFYADQANISVWALTAVQQAQAAKLVQGNDQNRFMPLANMTRAELAKLLIQWLAL